METRNTKLQIHHNAVAKHYMPYSRGISDSEDPEDLSTRTWLVSYPPQSPFLSFAFSLVLSYCSPSYEGINEN